MTPKTRDWSKLRTFVLRRDRYTCQRCERRLKTYELNAHHLIPRSEGGRDFPSNLLTLCIPCHDYVEVEDLRSPEAIRYSMQYELQDDHSGAKWWWEEAV